MYVINLRSVCIFLFPVLQSCMEQITCLLMDAIPKAEYVSLLNDYVESEFFLIDGDSLFITCARELTLQRGQNLHFFYLVERFLLDLTSKGAKYFIVFFKDVEHMYFRNPDFLSLRNALIIHLRKNTEIPIHTEFSNCLESSWHQFLQDNYPYFLIVADEGLDQLHTNFLHVFILHTLSKRVNIVLTSGQESDAIRVYGYHINSLFKYQTHFKQVNNRAYRKFAQFQKEIKDLRYVVCIITCSLVLETHMQVLERPTSSKTVLTLEDVGDLLRMYCLSVVFLHHLPLSQRSRVRFINACWNEETLRFMQQYKLCEFHVLQCLATQALKNVDFSTLPDLSDDLLLKNIAFYYGLEKGFDLDTGAKMNRDYELLWKHITELSGTCDFGAPFPLRRTSTTFIEEKYLSGKDKESKRMFPKPGLIPVMNTIVDEFAGNILTELPFLKTDDPVVTSLKKQKEFDELLHWHSGKPLSDDYDRTSEGFWEKKDPWALRQNQKLQAFQRFYGESLEGTISKKIAPQPDTPKKASPYATKSKKVQKTKAEIIIEENQKRKRAEEERKEERRWSALSVTIENNIKENMASGIKNLEVFLGKCQSAPVKCSAEMAALNVCFGLWTEHCKAAGETEKKFNIAAEVMRRIHSLIENYDHKDLLKETDFHQIAKCLWYFGFDNLATSLKYIKRKELKQKHAKYAVGMGSSRFQLQYMGHYLMREERKDPDPRVQHFIPDSWQRELLDIVDNNESAVIVAPTSSGKTYASYYCMEKILRDSDESVVVYVAPTKALVNQVSATIFNRFDKALPSGIALCGVFTREYRHDALNSQILVTVPQCLEILLLSPHRQEWAKKIRYVIFDEVHCLGGEIGAEVWEHLLVMIRCPFLALSATISNPKHLAEWLQSVKRYWQHTEAVIARNSSRSTSVKKGVKVKQSIILLSVVYEERYNDLEKYVCSLDNDDFTVHHYHPYAALTVDHIEKYGFPLDLSLSPREAVILYDIMVKARTDWPRANELDPEQFFKDKMVITKADARTYEKQLKEELEMWIKHGFSKEANRVLQLLKPQSTFSSEAAMRKHFPHFVDKLKQMDKLPGNVEKLFGNLSVLLCSDTKVRNYGKQLVWEAELDSLRKQLEKISETPSDCTYANEHAVDEETLIKIFDRLRYSRKKIELQGLALRGIGYHHSAVDAKGKQMVEMLFRKGYLQVVTATGTLALGINMPCKSVVFVQNSVYLDALHYRQMSGRAGRRGQDFLGDVFFYDIPLPKIQKLIKSNVPELRGQFPLSISLILRLLLLASKADDKEDAKAKVLSILKHSLLAFKQPRALKMLKLYFLFSLQFLVKEGYVDREGNTTGFAGLVTHLHYHEPSNIVLVDFLVKGLFHKLCQRSKEGPHAFSQDVMEKLVLVLAHLFGRRRIPAAVLNSRRTFYQSKVFLEDLPEDFAAALHEYNSKIKENFGQFLQIVSTMADMQQEYKLPLSELDFSSKKPSDSPLASHLMSCDEGRTAVSPFVCLSGNTEFDLLHKGSVNNVILRTIGINGANIPVLYSKICDNQGRMMPFNAYVLDFYKHGSLTAMEQDNRCVIHEGEAYACLKDFGLVLRVISVSLRELCDKEDDNVVCAFEQLSRNYWSKLEVV
uniref:DExD/H-box helicase 60 n=1 Tax=Podarcis muralis TaxID=64176 RepID=A0A670J159_PODMU